MTTIETPGGSQSTNAPQAPAAAAGPFLADPVLGILAEVVDDLESVRIANENRYRSLTDTSERGYGLSIHHPEVMMLAATVESMKEHEHQAILNLKRAMRRHPRWRPARPARRPRGSRPGMRRWRLRPQRPRQWRGRYRQPRP